MRILNCQNVPVLEIFPRSGLGFKYRVQLDNTVGVIDGDYYHADNEGHIMIKITNDSRENKPVQDLPRAFSMNTASLRMTTQTKSGLADLAALHKTRAG